MGPPVGVKADTKISFEDSCNCTSSCLPWGRKKHKHHPEATSQDVRMNQVYISHLKKPENQTQ